MANYFVLLLVVLTAHKGISSNLCGLASCNGKEHIDCTMGVEGTWGPTCPKDKAMLNLRNAQNAILDKHNTMRNQIAGGLVDGFPPAVQMGTFTWHIVLANLARENVRQCMMKHDGCRNTEDLNYVGQNLAFKRYPKTQTFDNLQVLLDLCDLWLAELQNATAATINPYNQNDKIFGHFTQVIKMQSSRLGCAAVRTTDENFDYIYFGCNYDLGNIVGYPTYVEGPKASKCQTGKNPTYPNLCSTAETYNVNQFWL